MKYQASDFLELRERIVKNAILNHLLIAYLLNAEEYSVGTTLTWVNGRLKGEMIKAKKQKLPKYVMANVVVTLKPTFAVGRSYLPYPIIWEKCVEKNPTQGIIANLKALTLDIYNTHSMNAVKLDRTFSHVNESMLNFFETNDISVSWWKIGFKKKEKQREIGSINEEEVEAYYKTLRLRLIDWVNFNNILISLIKTRRFSANNAEFGSIRIKAVEEKNTVILTMDSSADNFHLSTCLRFADFSPASWNALSKGVDIYLLRNIMKQP